MEHSTSTFGERCGRLPHQSFFRRRILARSRADLGPDPVHEYLVDQANARGFLGAYSDREPAAVDPDLTAEDIIVGLLQPHAPCEPRILKLVVRAIQSGRLDPDRLVFRAKRERALAVLRWLTSLIPEPERNESVVRLAEVLASTPARDERPPRIEYDPMRLLRKRSR